MVRQSAPPSPIGSDVNAPVELPLRIAWSAAPDDEYSFRATRAKRVLEDGPGRRSSVEPSPAAVARVLSPPPHPDLRPTRRRDAPDEGPHDGFFALLKVDSIDMTASFGRERARDVYPVSHARCVAGEECPFRAWRPLEAGARRR